MCIKYALSVQEKDTRLIAQKHSMSTVCNLPGVVRKWMLISTTNRDSLTFADRAFSRCRLIDRLNLRCCLLNFFPSPCNVSSFCVRLPDTKAQRKSIVQARMCEVKRSTLVKTIHQFLVDVISTSETKTHQIERRRNNNLKTIVLFDPFRKILSQFNMAPHMILQTLNSVMADYEP